MDAVRGKDNVVEKSAETGFCAWKLILLHLVSNTHGPKPEIVVGEIVQNQFLLFAVASLVILSPCEETREK